MISHERFSSKNPLLPMPRPKSSGATFSPCRTWRYTLWRHWDWRGDAHCVAFIGLNPSTADETKNDPTVRRCINYAKEWGYGGMYMLNIFGYRATDPAVMKAALDPVGPENDRTIAKHVRRCGLVIACWGVHGAFSEREQRITQLPQVRQKLHCLGQTKAGHPRHPLYLPKSARPVLWQADVETLR